jgi:UDP-glucuronate decarboxylase
MFRDEQPGSFAPLRMTTSSPLLTPHFLLFTAHFSHIQLAHDSFDASTASHGALDTKRTRPILGLSVQVVRTNWATADSADSIASPCEPALRVPAEGSNGEVTVVQIPVRGGAGFIGSRLCEGLSEAGEDIICLDKLFTSSRDNVAHLLDCPRFELVRVIEPICREVDQIYSLACPASPLHFQFNPVQTVEANVVGTLNALRLAHQIGARILQASTSEVYGDPTVHPQTESYRGNVNPIGLRACYDEGKRVAETLMMDYHRQDGVDIRIARIFNTYGPRMDESDGRVVSNFILQALRGEPLTLYGTGEQTRSFCYVDDLVEGLIRLMHAEGIYEPVNLGNPLEFTIRALAEEVAHLCGTPSSVRYCPLPQDDPVQRRPDITRAQRLLDWAPTVQLREGLQRTIDDFRTRLSRPRRRGAGRRAARHAMTSVIQ